MAAKAAAAAVSATDDGRRRRLLGAAATAAAAVVVVVGGGGFRAATSNHRPRQRPSKKRAYALSIGMGRNGREKKTSDKRTKIRTFGVRRVVVAPGTTTTAFVKRTWGVCGKKLKKTPGDNGQKRDGRSRTMAPRCKRSPAVDGSGRTTITSYTTDGTA